MLTIHKNVDGTYWIDLEVNSDEKPVLKFSGNFQRVGDIEGESDKTMTITVHTFGDPE